MNDSYKQLIEDNHNLIYGFLHKYNLGEDYYGDAAIGLCKAAKFYNSDSGNNFSTFAYKCMFNECGCSIRKEIHNGTQLLSLDAPIVISEESETDLRSILTSGHTIDEFSDSLSHVLWFIEKMNLRDLKILYYRLLGYKSREIANILKCTYQNVSLRIKKMKNAYENGMQVRSKEDNCDSVEYKHIFDKIIGLLTVTDF